MRIFTIGFSKKGAEIFFSILKKVGVKTVIDARYNHNSQISGYAKSEDMKFFWKGLGLDIDWWRGNSIFILPF